MSAIIIGVGLVGAGCAGAFVDKTKRFQDTLKFLFCLACVSAFAVCIIHRLTPFHLSFPGHKVYDGTQIRHAGLGNGCLGLPWYASHISHFVIHILAGLAAFAILPVALELSVETTYPVNEGTSAGFLWVAAQAFSIGIVSSMEALEGPFVFECI